MNTKERTEYMKKWRKEHPNQYKEYQKEWKKQHKDYNREYRRKWSKTEKGRESTKRDVQRRKEQFLEIKKQYSCAICGEGDPCCLDFHHIDPTKKESLISRAAQSWGLKRLKKEIKKCRVLCANCHGKLHFYGEEE